MTTATSTVAGKTFSGFTILPTLPLVCICGGFLLFGVQTCTQSLSLMVISGLAFVLALVGIWRPRANWDPKARAWCGCLDRQVWLFPGRYSRLARSAVLAKSFALDPLTMLSMDASSSV